MTFLLRISLLFPMLIACGAVEGTSIPLRDDGDAKRLEGGHEADAVHASDVSFVPETGSADRSTPPDASPGPCPVSAPTAGTTCSIEDFICAYGTNPNPRCNELFQCIGAAWQATEGAKCPSVINPTCPPSYSAADGTTCVSSVESQLCAYPGEGTCVCGYPGQGMPALDWVCTGAATGCPLMLPALGSPCPSDSASICNYGGCSAPATTCLGGYWSLYLAGCD